MNILLLVPPCEEPKQRDAVIPRVSGIRLEGRDMLEPLGLAYIGAVLKQDGHEISLIDGTASLLDLDSLLSMQGYKTADLVVSVSSTPTFNGDLQTFQAIKKDNKIVIVTGTYPTVFPDLYLKGSADYVARGEPEETLSELVNALERKQPISGIKGISYSNGGQIINNPKRPLIRNLDELPFPDRSLFNYGLYSGRRNSLDNTQALMLLSKGCIFECAICNESVYYGKARRERSIENIVDEISDVIQRYGIRDFRMMDPLFFPNRAKAGEFADALEQRGLKIKWTCETRLDLLDEQTLLEMKRSGCYQIGFGLESANEEILAGINKKIDLGRAKELIRYAEKIGIEVFAFLVFGLPGETHQTMDKTIDYVIKANPSLAAFNLATPEPGTPFYYIVPEIRNAPLEHYDRRHVVYTPLGLAKGDIEAKIAEGYKRFYLRPGYFMKRLYSDLRRPQRLIRDIRSAYELFKIIAKR